MSDYAKPLSSLIDIPIKQYSDEEIDLIEKNEAQEKRLAHFSKSGVGYKYLDKTIDDFVCYNDEMLKNKNEISMYIDDIQSGRNKSLWLCGANGNGKTFLGAMIVRECWGTFRDSSIIEDEIEETKYFSTKESLIQLRERYASYPLLVIDEVGRFPSDNEKKYLFKIINDRYNADKPTVLISNMTRKGLVEYLGKAATDRFIENCSSVSFTSPSYRETERKNKEQLK